jgi:NTP pyrophosphatase (non-canonical NTP hydrolase)
MKLSEYQQAARRTMSDAEPHDKNILGCTLGLLDEADEWYYAEPEERAGEAGDLLWYVAAVATLHNIDLGTLPEPAPAKWHRVRDEVHRRAGKIGGRVKKETFHGHPHEPETMRAHLATLLANLKRWCLDADTTLERVAVANIAKLARRYPQGFSTADSIRRVDVAAPIGGGGSGAG